MKNSTAGIWLIFRGLNFSLNAAIGKFAICGWALTKLLEIAIFVCYGALMNHRQPKQAFDPDQIQMINHAVTMAEELVSNYYKMSASQWLRPKYDIKTLADLEPAEILDGPFAQIVRYEGQRHGTSLGSELYDYYKICLQDHTILAALETDADLRILPFSLYIITHELVHIVRFSRFLQSFDATPNEKLAEEHRVHEITHQILLTVRMEGLDSVIAYYHRWRSPLENLSDV